MAPALAGAFTCNAVIRLAAPRGSVLSLRCSDLSDLERVQTTSKLMKPALT